MTKAKLQLKRGISKAIPYSRQQTEEAMCRSESECGQQQSNSIYGIPYYDLAPDGSDASDELKTPTVNV